MKYTNFAKGTLTAELSNVGVSLTITTTESFPQDGEFRAVIWSASENAPQQDSTREIMTLLWDTDHYDIVSREQEGTTAKTWASGSYIAHTVTASQFTEYEAKQDTLVSGTNIKTINSTTVLGSGNIDTPDTTYDKATGAELDTGTDDAKFATAKALADSSYEKNPMTTAGDTIYGGTDGVQTRLAKGTASQVLTMNSGATAPEWQTLYSVSTDASSATPTPTGDSKNNEYYLTALAVGATFAAPSGTPVNGNRLVIRIKDNGTARSLGWNVIYNTLEFELPATTVAEKTIYLGFTYNSASSKWDLLAINEEQA